MQNPDGSWRTLRRPWVRLALLPHALNDPKSERHVSPRERVTFVGRTPLLRNQPTWLATTVVNCEEQAMSFATTLETYKGISARVHPARKQAREEGLDYEAQLAATAAAVHAHAS